MHYDPILDAEFSSSVGSYLNRYVDHNPFNDESISRYRRFTAFLEYSGLTEEKRFSYKGSHYGHHPTPRIQK